MLFEDKLHDIIKTLESEQMLLLPIEFAWAAVAISEEVLLEKWSLHEFQHLDDTIYVMMRDLPMLKRYNPKLHPRVETLLHYHRRPLGLVQTPTFRDEKESQFILTHCITLDPYCHRIVDLLGVPVSCTYLRYGARLIGDYHHIPSAVKQKAAYISKRVRNTKLSAVKPIAVSYDEDGNLIFPNKD